MNYDRIKKIISILFIVGGGLALITEIAAAQKNYYIQSIGLILLMFGLFLVNSKLPSKFNENPAENQYDEEE
ncbi:hypothetical protein M0D21_21145 [Aquimarina sp. D1M17]|uniref:hypothetical protein n=1 Tax=Aquimarina acroporae TaxID=2937283 RepID=UPI0020BF95F5|nr:hypothetical protein [Aquimarina acroporae]MCK8524098.1 hypothetical protein [Aquimarina acroporae]